MKKLLLVLLTAMVIGGCSGKNSGSVTDSAQQSNQSTQQDNNLQTDQTSNTEAANHTDPREENKQTSSAYISKDTSETPTVISLDESSGKIRLASSSKEQRKTSQARKAPAAQFLDTSKLPDTYSFADKTGKYLILYSNTTDTKMDRAIGDGGKVLTIKYVRKQDSNSKNDGREWAKNFDNMAGVIYQVVGGKAVPNDTYYLVNSKKVNVKAVLPVTNEIKAKVEPSVKMKLEKLKSLKLKNIWEIAHFGKGNKVYVAEFKKKGNKVTASIILKTASKLVTKDYVADYDPITTWRVDDGGEIVPESFSLLFSAVTKQGYLIGVKWAGAEGETTDLLNQTSTELKEIEQQTNGRYMVP
ncbi:MULTISPECIES: hypothetical protein [Paenibacillus]|uniref:hypothetical protein n=1 Tax=Paenibacillus TaxID=44249 RepID=UPI0008399849|nr:MULTISPECIES: hypothetical protein [Paenibacillus]GIP21656.1 hypothetical protein J22TS3_19310 [Paenibacillus sp. J22TS3]